MFAQSDDDLFGDDDFFADDGIEEPEYSQEAKDNLAEKIREFDARLKLDRERLAFDKDKAKTDARLKEKQINKKPTTSK